MISNLGGISLVIRHSRSLMMEYVEYKCAKIMLKESAGGCLTVKICLFVPRLRSMEIMYSSLGNI